MTDPGQVDTADARLWRALKRLVTINSFLQTGAHPDDESSALLARLSLGDGVRVGYACAVRGEGGQNAIGPETGIALGVLRTLEMQAAARVLGIDLYWLNEDVRGPLHDFGFTKSPEAAFVAWGRERVTERLVRAIRVHRPDAMMPSFLDVPGQHGHHRAVTQATIAAFHLAGDRAAFPAHAAEGIPPWQPGKLYLPAWSGADTTYDDAALPPRASVTVEAGTLDPVLGATYAQIGEWSRANHYSQGMGVARDAAPHPVALHRLAGGAATPEDERSPFDGLPRSLGDLAATFDDAAVATPLREAQHAIERALDAFPRRGDVAACVHAALAAVRRAQAALPEGSDDVASRLATKVLQLAVASREALLPEARCTIGRATIVPGGSVDVAVACATTAPEGLETALAAPPGFVVERTTAGFRVTAPHDAAITSPYRFAVPSDAPLSAIHAVMRYAVGGVAVEVALDAVPGIAVVPPASLAVESAAIPWNLEAPPPSPALAVELRAAAGTHRVALEASSAWPVAAAAAAATLVADGARAALSFTLAAPRNALPGQADLRLSVDGAPARNVTRIVHPRLGDAHLVTPAQVTLRSMRVRLPAGRIGAIDGGSDKVWHWLRLIGLTVDLVDDGALPDLQGYDTIVVGIFAFRTRPALREAVAPLKAWMRAGGHLVTLYHRPQDCWDPDLVPPYHLSIGRPSLHWRVSDPRAAVTALLPDHPLLNLPNRIGPEDWSGWVHERGLHFAARWAPQYEALLALADPGEPPLTGGLLTARFGAGRHTHVSLALHRQLPALVPGAYRLLANLVAPAQS